MPTYCNCKQCVERRNAKKDPLIDKDRKCRVCGCTDDNCLECIKAQGHPCWWVEDDLCSRCQENPKFDKRKPKGDAKCLR